MSKRSRETTATLATKTKNNKYSNIKGKSFQFGFPDLICFFFYSKNERIIIRMLIFQMFRTFNSTVNIFICTLYRQISSISNYKTMPFFTSYIKDRLSVVVLILFHLFSVLICIDFHRRFSISRVFCFFFVFLVVAKWFLRCCDVQISIDIRLDLKYKIRFT